MENKKYDYLIVGCGLFGAVCAYKLLKNNKNVLIIDKREHIGGNIYTEKIQGINVHKYGAHIFHTSNKKIWKFINKFAKFNNYINSPIANYNNILYNLPFNMNTFYQLWQLKTPEEVFSKIEEQKKCLNKKIPENLEEQAISLVGTDIFNILIKDYTEKQWGKKCTELPIDIIKRLPVRLTYNNNYFNDNYQGIPIGGYTKIIEKMIKGADLLLNENFLDNKEYWLNIADNIIYTGKIDEFYNYCYGPLEYRSLIFDTKIKNIPNFQGNAVINYTSHNEKYTRIIEHKHFENLLNDDIYKNNKTVITYEYPEQWDVNKESYYPINDSKNLLLYEKYKELSKNNKNIIFGGRLGSYKYYDMDDIIEEALKLNL